MSTTGYLFGDEREKGLPYALFMDGLEGDDGEEAGTIEVRFRDLWEAVDALGKVRDELGAFDLRLGEPDHFEEARAHGGFAVSAHPTTEHEGPRDGNPDATLHGANAAAHHIVRTLRWARRAEKRWLNAKQRGSPNEEWLFEETIEADLALDDALAAYERLAKLGEAGEGEADGTV